MIVVKPIKTDYTQIVDDLRTLKNKYNNFKVDHAQTETKLKHIQREAMDYERYQYNSSKIRLQIYFREICDLSNRYALLNELKDKITQENDYLQKQNDHLLRENDELNKDTLATKDACNDELRRMDSALGEVRRQKERVEEKMMQQYKSPSPPKKPKGFLGKLKSLGKKETKKSRYSEPVTHVPLKKDHEEVDQQTISFRHSDWSRTSSQSLDPDVVTRGSSRSLRSDTRSRVSASDRSDARDQDEDEMKVDDLDLSTIEKEPKEQWFSVDILK
jgi:hypothetical protein